MEAEAVEEGGDGGAGVFAGGVEDSVGEGGLLELLLRFGAGVGLEVLVDGDEQAGGAGVDAGVLVVEAGDEELRGGQRDVDGAGAAGLGYLDVLGFQLREIDSGYGLAVDYEEDAVSGEEVGEDGAGFVALDDGVDGVDDGLEALRRWIFWTTAGTETSKVVARPVMAEATRARKPEVAWRMKTPMAVAPRMSARRKATKVPEGARPEEY